MKYIYAGNMTRRFEVPPDYMRDMSCVLVYVLVVSPVVYVDAVHVTLYVYIPAYYTYIQVTRLAGLKFRITCEICHAY